MPSLPSDFPSPTSLIFLQITYLCLTLHDRSCLLVCEPEYWHSLQVGGLICAGVLCALGIIIVMSAKCKCKFGQKSSHRPGETPPLITPGSAQN
ncbi:FXYD domain-containing ion transport regulator 3 isoform X2 [Hylobates moloch]|uniref:FXYD domain-containing ion transport regulator 3 isoform X2 n=1 Tax=Hylobates moloch TaxID=81572 RepID=UPI001363C4F8|nr:FXYD domain-containing ion transport regulator 3 isoform X2 [Hylobates moloch]